MKGGRAAGLVCAGGVGQSFVARLPALLASVSLVKATSFRVARRIANSLRAGRAVEHYAAARAGRSDLDRGAGRRARKHDPQPCGGNRRKGEADRDLCDTARDSLWPDSLQKAGARIASINAIGPNDETLIAEGHPHALREVRRFAAADHRKVIEIRPGSKRLFLAGVHLATHIALPGIAAAVESLRVAGFSRAEATRLVEELGGRTLRAYAKAGPKAWSPAAAQELRRALDAAQGMRFADVRTADLYQAGIERALRFFGE